MTILRSQLTPHPELTYQAEMSLAHTYFTRKPQLARLCVLTAIDAAVQMARPELAWSAASLLEAM